MKLLRIFILFLLPLYTSAQIRLEKRTFFDNKLQMLVPASLKPLPVNRLNKKYPNAGARPSIILTDAKEEAKLVINYVVTQPLQDTQIDMFEELQVHAMKNMHPEAKWLESGVKTIHGKKVGFFKVIRDIKGKPEFNYFMLTTLSGKTLMISISVPGKLYNQWQKNMEIIAGSVMTK